MKDEGRFASATIAVDAEFIPHPSALIPRL